MRCSENMGTDFPNHSQHCCPGLLMLIYSLLSVQTEVGISILVSSFMALIEFTIIFFNITIVEKTNIPKSLKGGCL